jgi:DNA replication ATP-dependent helicase Dna2
MPSIQTRTKLKAFQFIEGAPSVETAKEREAEKENLPAALGKATKSMGTPKASRVMKDAGTTNKTPKLPTTIDCPPPSTPATTRLPLADLVGNIDDSSRQAPQPVPSPEEQLIWRGSQAVNTPLPRKNKKRARSSSPAAPSQEEHRHDPTRNDVTTPQADPALELWSRYTNCRDTPTANKSVAFAHLINESSPRSAAAAAAGSVNGLRRWASCGDQFPASNRKRRRTHGVFQAETENTEDVFACAPSSDGMMRGQPVKPNIANMVQRMRECVTRSQPRINSQLPSSSSPLPGGDDRQDSLAGSPLQRRIREQDADTSETLQDEQLLETEAGMDDDLVQDEEHVDAEPIHNTLPPASQGSSDEFGDDDFDADMVEALDPTPQAVEIPAPTTSYVTIPTEPVYRPPGPRELAAAPPVQAGGDDDDFGLDDEDDFAADLEHVASLYDTRAVESPLADTAPLAGTAGIATAQNVASAPVISLLDDDEDEFGGDIDADEFAAAEVAATQAPVNNVRRTRTYP